MTRMFGCQMVGVGVGALGVLLAADRLGVLPNLLDRGVVLIDRLPQGRMSGAHGLAYAVSSNSRGGEFIAGIAGDGAFAHALSSFWGRRLQAARDQPVRLKSAARFFNEIAARAFAIVQDHGGGRVALGRDVVSIMLDPRGRICTRDASGEIIAVSRTIVISPGGWQEPGGLRLPLPAGDPRPPFPADQLLRQGGGAVVSLLRRGTARRIGIIGGSHSAFSLAALLVRRAGRHLGEGAVRIVHRRRVRHYYGSLAEARRMRIGHEPLDVCPDTGIVNRFDGLRGEAAAFSRLVLSGKETRVSLVRAGHGPDSLKDALGGADIVVDATGYDAPPLPLFAANGSVLDIDRRHGFPVDGRNRLLRSDGGVLDGVYVTGLARRYVSPAKPSLRAVGAGAGVFQQIDGVIIARELADGRAPPVVTSPPSSVSSRGSPAPER